MPDLPEEGPRVGQLFSASLPELPVLLKYGAGHALVSTLWYTEFYQFSAPENKGGTVPGQKAQSEGYGEECMHAQRSSSSKSLSSEEDLRKPAFERSLVPCKISGSFSFCPAGQSRDSQ